MELALSIIIGGAMGFGSARLRRRVTSAHWWVVPVVLAATIFVALMLVQPHPGDVTSGLVAYFVTLTWAAQGPKPPTEA